MFKLFGSFCKRIESDKTLKLVVMLTKDGKNAEALKKCSELVEQYPYDVQIRHGLAMIQKEMGQEIKLPDISPTIRGIVP